MTTQQRLSRAATATLHPPREPKDWNPIASPPPTVEHAYHLGRKSIIKLYNTPADQVHRYDIAEMNLISAAGLPGAKDLDIGAMLATLEQWTKGAAEHILKSAGKFPKYRAKFQGSLARFRITLLIQYLVWECGVRPSPDQMFVPIPDPPPMTDPRDVFIHGLLGEKHTGTCSSLPVLLIAVGRKLGYPLKLVLAPQHAFSRWDSPSERFNIEMRIDGLNSQPDEYYLHWPFEWPPELHARERIRPYLMQSMTPPQEPAFCAANRCRSLDVAGRFKEALASMRVANRLWPAKAHAVWINHLTTKVNFPNRKWPHAPCEETCGKESILRMAKQLGMKVPDNI